MLWIKWLHLVFMVTWFAGLFYLPRLFVYHAMSSDEVSLARFEVMERKLFFGIMTPGAVITIALGLWLWLGFGPRYSGDWLAAKLTLVAVLVVYHLWCAKLMLDFRRRRNAKSHVWFRWFNEVPVLFLLAIAYLAVFKPFSVL